MSYTTEINELDIDSQKANKLFDLVNPKSVIVRLVQFVRNRLNPAVSYTFNPSIGLKLDNLAGNIPNQYQQSGALRINIIDAVIGGWAELKVIKDGNAVTLYVGSTDITTIGKDPGSSDFDSTVGNVDRILIWKDVSTTDNSTGVYYTVTNLG